MGGRGAGVRAGGDHPLPQRKEVDKNARVALLRVMHM